MRIGISGILFSSWSLLSSTQFCHYRISSCTARKQFHYGKKHPVFFHGKYYEVWTRAFPTNSINDTLSSSATLNYPFVMWTECHAIFAVYVMALSGSLAHGSTNETRMKKVHTHKYNEIGEFVRSTCLPNISPWIQQRTAGHDSRATLFFDCTFFIRLWILLRFVNLFVILIWIVCFWNFDGK